MTLLLRRVVSGTAAAAGAATAAEDALRFVRASADLYRAIAEQRSAVGTAALNAVICNKSSTGARKVSVLWRARGSYRKLNSRERPVKTADQTHRILPVFPQEWGNANAPADIGRSLTLTGDNRGCSGTCRKSRRRGSKPQIAGLTADSLLVKPTRIRKRRVYRYGDRRRSR